MNRQMYLSVWIPLDDVGPGNGGLVLPGEEEIERAAAARKRRRRRRSNLDGDGENEDGNENDKDPSSSIPLVAAAGTAVAMASWLRHASGPNDSGRPRRAWMPQLKLGAVEVEGEEEEGEEEEGGDSGERRARMRGEDFRCCGGDVEGSRALQRQCRLKKRGLLEGLALARLSGVTTKKGSADWKRGRGGRGGGGGSKVEFFDFEDF